MVGSDLGGRIGGSDGEGDALEIRKRFSRDDICRGRIIVFFGKMREDEMLRTIFGKKSCEFRTFCVGKMACIGKHAHSFTTPKLPF